MSYAPTNWNTGDTITASALNKIENGIANAGSGDILFDIADEDGTLDKTWTEIYSALVAGKIARIVGSRVDSAWSNYVAAATTDGEFWYVYITGEQGWYQASSANGYPQFTD